MRSPLVFATSLALFLACVLAAAPVHAAKPARAAAPAPRTATAVFAGGCFWCLETQFESFPGVKSVTSGYTGGSTVSPTYQAVCTGETGHAEVVQVRFDPRKLPYEHLLAWFWKLHDPTTLNRQGADEGTQYRSAIFYHSEAQRLAAIKSKEAEDKSGHFSSPIVTEITPIGVFYPAEDYHRDYYMQNKSKGYCRFVIAPKLEKLGLAN